MQAAGGVFRPIESTARCDHKDVVTVVDVDGGGGGGGRRAAPALSAGRTAVGGVLKMVGALPHVNRFCQLCQLGYITLVGSSHSLVEKQAILTY